VQTEVSIGKLKCEFIVRFVIIDNVSLVIKEILVVLVVCLLFSICNIRILVSVNDR